MVGSAHPTAATAATVAELKRISSFLEISLMAWKSLHYFYKSKSPLRKSILSGEILTVAPGTDARQDSSSAPARGNGQEVKVGVALGRGWGDRPRLEW